MRIIWLPKGFVYTLTLPPYVNYVPKKFIFSTAFQTENTIHNLKMLSSSNYFTVTFTRVKIKFQAIFTSSGKNYFFHTKE